MERSIGLEDIATDCINVFQCRCSRMRFTRLILHQQLQRSHVVLLAITVAMAIWIVSNVIFRNGIDVWQRTESNIFYHVSISSAVGSIRKLGINIERQSNESNETRSALIQHGVGRITNTVPGDLTSLEAFRNKTQYPVIIDAAYIRNKTQYPVIIDAAYIINNPDICKYVENINLLVIVHSATDHFQRRRTMRETWANPRAYNGFTFRIIFLFGTPKDKVTQSLLENESAVYKDVVQGDFIDSYKNLTNKAILGYRWMSAYCSKSELILKIDDDVYVNVFQVIDYYYPTYRRRSKFMLCQLFPDGKAKIRRGNKKDKWFVSEDEFPGRQHYPAYCGGFAVFMSPDIIKGLFSAASSTPFFWIDDVYVFGLLAKKVGVKLESIGDNFTIHEKHGLRVYEGNGRNDIVISAARSDPAMKRFWFATLQRISPKLRRYVGNEWLIIVDRLQSMTSLPTTGMATKTPRAVPRRA